jgi:hypothetical protein
MPSLKACFMMATRCCDGPALPPVAAEATRRCSTRSKGYGDELEPKGVSLSSRSERQHHAWQEM